MKARNLLWITVINIFLILMVSVLMEYTDLNSRFKQLENTVSTATDTALDSSTASEEFFSSKYASSMTSYATNGTKKNINGGIRIFSPTSNSWVSGEVYKMAYFYAKKGKFPSSQSEYNTFTTNVSTETIYEWLFGKVGTVYSKYPWANSKTKLWNSLKWNGYSTDRTPTSNFKSYYDAIGKLMTTTTYVKVKSGNSYNVTLSTISTLTQMGLSLDSSLNGNTSGGSTTTNDYLSSVVHFGKASNGIADTAYYLTPFSLGVTYVPLEVFKPVFLAHLDQLVRLESVKHTVTSDSDVQDFKSSTGCISTEVYDGDIGNAIHKDTASTNIINDGEIEYDLSTAKVKVDYFLVDFYDNSNYLVVNRIEGSTSQYNGAGNPVVNNSNNILNLPERLKAKDTSNLSTTTGRRIVAKVTVKIKIHIPYKSSILQWFRHMNDEDGSNHYDIRLWDESNNTVEFESNGLWYEYSTYTAIAR